MSIDTGSLKAGLGKVAQAMESCKDELNAIDGELGDGDLGVTMGRGMETIMAETDGLPEDLGMAIFACSKCFTKVSGSSYGTLVATGLMAAAKECKGQQSVEWARVSELVGLAAEAMKNRGKAEYGDKTVLDTLAAVRDGTAGASDQTSVAEQAVQAARQALADFKDKPAKTGRARMFGDKSVGLDDPGMLAMTRVIEALAGG